MRIFWLFLLAALPSAQAGTVHLAELRGSINPGSAEFVLESLKKAESANADLFVLRLDTPGGLLASTRSIIQGFNEATIPVLVWVSPGGASATSAGALLAMSSHFLVMQKGTNLGAAHPVGGSGEEIKGPMGEKITNDTAALARAQASLRGRNQEAAERIVTKSQSFSAEEAVKDNVVDFLADDLDTVFRSAENRSFRIGTSGKEKKIQVGPAPEIFRHKMNARQKFLHFIADPNISALLLSLGGLAIWAEISSGFHSLAAGVIGIICFLLGFMSMQTLPINTGGAVLLVLGLCLLVAEAFVTSFGLLFVAGLSCLFLGGMFLIDPASSSMQVSLFLLLSIVAALATVMGIVGWILSRDKHHPRSAEPNQLPGSEATISTIDAHGTSGTAQVHGELWTFESDDPVRPGDKLLVGSVHGMKIHLKRKR